MSDVPNTRTVQLTPRKASRSVISFRIDSKLRKRLGEIKELTGAKNITETIRQSMVVYDALISEVASGATIIVSNTKLGTKTEYKLLESIDDEDDSDPKLTPNKNQNDIQKDKLVST